MLLTDHPHGLLKLSVFIIPFVLLDCCHVILHPLSFPKKNLLILSIFA